MSEKITAPVRAKEPLPPSSDGKRRRGLTSSNPTKVSRAVRSELNEVVLQLWRAADKNPDGSISLDPKRANALTVALQSVARVSADERIAALEEKIAALQVAIEGFGRNG